LCPCKMIEFFVPCNPPRSTAQSAKRVGVKKDGKPFSFTTQKGKKQEAEFASLLMPHVPEAPFEGALQLRVIYRLPFLSTEKKAIKERGWAFHYKRPDCDNLLKMFQDTMGRLRFWNDDSQVAELRFAKVRHKEAGIYVALKNINEDNYNS
jgi:Holliday junction resolvase RusA-like endonuclease